METREQRKQIIMSAVEQFLDHLEEDFDNDDDWEKDLMIGAVVIAAEINVTPDDVDIPSTVPTFWCSNENSIWQRGFFEILADYKTISGLKGD